MICVNCHREKTCTTHFPGGKIPLVEAGYVVGKCETCNTHDVVVECDAPWEQ